MTTKAVSAVKLSEWFDSELSWPSGDPANLALVADLERRFPPLQDPATGTRVGIGVASGADSVYLTDDTDVVEPDRLLPLLMTRDTTIGRGEVVRHTPRQPVAGRTACRPRRLPTSRRRTFVGTSSDVRGRHVARKNPAAAGTERSTESSPELQDRDKLVIPDLKAFIQPVLDRGETYPHHGLYFITSDEWDLEVLGGLLLSDIAELFVATYCVKMRGGCYRFQAQYLRRIRVPAVASVGKREQRQLRQAFASRDRERAPALSPVGSTASRATLRSPADDRQASSVARSFTACKSTHAL